MYYIVQIYHLYVYVSVYILFSVHYIIHQKVTYRYDTYFIFYDYYTPFNGKL